MKGGAMRAGFLAAALGLLLLVPSTASAKPLAKSTFTNGTEKWKVVGDVSGDPEKPDVIATGGNPGGFVQVTDQAVGGVMFWRAPDKFVGDQGAAYKGTLKFSLTQSASDTQFDDDDLILDGNHQTLILDLAENPPVFPVWGAVTTEFAPGAGWMDTTVLPPTPATGKDLKGVLNHLHDLYIRAEYRTGDDTDGLDTVILRHG